MPACPTRDYFYPFHRRAHYSRAVLDGRRAHRPQRQSNHTEKRAEKGGAQADPVEHTRPRRSESPLVTAPKLTTSYSTPQVSHARSYRPQAAPRPVDYSIQVPARPRLLDPRHLLLTTEARAAPVPFRNPRFSNAPASHVAPRRHPSHTTPPSCHQEENGLHPEHHPPHHRSANISVVHFFEPLSGPRVHARARLHTARLHRL